MNRSNIHCGNLHCRYHGLILVCILSLKTVKDSIKPVLSWWGFVTQHEMSDPQISSCHVLSCCCEHFLSVYSVCFGFLVTVQKYTVGLETLKYPQVWMWPGSLSRVFPCFQPNACWDRFCPPIRVKTGMNASSHLEHNLFLCFSFYLTEQQKTLRWWGTWRKNSTLVILWVMFSVHNISGMFSSTTQHHSITI